MHYSGIPAAPGIAVGKILKYETAPLVIENNKISPEETEESLNRYSQVKDKVKKELTALRDLVALKDAKQAGIFEAQMDLLDDVEMEGEILSEIRGSLSSPEYALSTVFERYGSLLGKAKNPMIRERASDIADVRRRFLNCWFGKKDEGLTGLEEPVILAAHDLLPSETAGLNKDSILGIVGEVGGLTSHTAILSRTLKIPAVLGIGNLLSRIENGQTAIVDGVRGELILSPSTGQMIEYGKRSQVYRDYRKNSDVYLDRDALTKDGTRIEVCINLEGAGEEALLQEGFVDGVGLFRTEFLYMGRSELPSEEEGYRAYRKVLKRFGNKPVVIRTLDIGGDKQLECLQLEKEANPFLGLRAIRLCLKDRELFRTQLRGILRAGSEGNLSIMLPMISGMEEIHETKKFINEVIAELAEEKVPFCNAPKLGIMVEVPSIALVADLAAKEADFASIGTNDLCQYLMAADRMNSKVAQCYQSFHPCMFRILSTVVQAFHSQGKPVSVCGSMAGNPMFAAVLLGLGIRKLSVDISETAEIKRFLSLLTIDKAEEIARAVAELSTAHDIESFLLEQMEVLGYSSYYAI